MQTLKWAPFAPILGALGCGSPDLSNFTGHWAGQIQIVTTCPDIPAQQTLPYSATFTAQGSNRLLLVDTVCTLNLSVSGDTASLAGLWGCLRLDFMNLLPVPDFSSGAFMFTSDGEHLSEVGSLEEGYPDTCRYELRVTATRAAVADSGAE